MKVHHIGYLVENIEEATIEFEKLGYTPKNEVVVDEFREIKVIFVQNREYLVELIQPLNEKSPIYGLRKKYNNSPYHICYETKDIQKQIKEFSGGGYMVITEPQTASAIKGSPLVAFLMSCQVGMIELVEVI